MTSAAIPPAVPPVTPHGMAEVATPVPVPLTATAALSG